MKELKQEVKNTADLRKAMNELELKIRVQEVQMKDHVAAIKQDLEPKNLVKNTYSRLAETPEIQRTLVNTAIGFILGYASKRAAEVLSEKSLDRVVKSVLNAGLNQIEQKKRYTLLGKTVILLRKHTPTDSPLYPFVSYQGS